MGRLGDPITAELDPVDTGADLIEMGRCGRRLESVPPSLALHRERRVRWPHCHPPAFRLDRLRSWSVIQAELSSEGYVVCPTDMWR
jgi:hypothetical protein